MEERLQKIIARAGVASRRHAEELITSGMVTVNGATITKLGSKADAARDHIKVNGKLLPQAASERVYLLLHKPAEVVSTMSDPEGRRSLQDLLHGVSQRVFPVGRLEYHSSGLVFLTNDGDLANLIIQSHGLPQTYQMKLKNLLTFAEIELLARKTGARITRLKGQDNPWYLVTLTESRRDALRGLLFQSGHPVEKIKRVGIGTIELEKLAPGQHRMLSSGEVAALRRSAEAPPPVAAPSVERTEVAAPKKTFAPRETISAPPSRFSVPPRAPAQFAAGAYKKPPRFDRAHSSDRPASSWKGAKPFGKGAHTPGRPAFRGPSNPPNPRERNDETRRAAHTPGRPGSHGPSRPRDDSAGRPRNFRSGGRPKSSGPARPPKPFDKPRRDFRGPSNPAGPRPAGPRENSGNRSPGAPGRFGKPRPGNDRPGFAKKSGARGPASSRPSGHRPPRRPHSGKPHFPRRDRT